MIRKVIIVVLSLAAIATLGLGIVSYWTEVRFSTTLVGKPTFGLAFGFSSQVSHSFLLASSWIHEGAQARRYRRYGNWELAIATDSRPGWNCLEYSTSAGGSYPGWAPNRPPGTAKSVHCLLTWWLAFILLSAYPVAAFVRGPLRQWHRRRRREKGLCVECGYDLTANVSGVCPECGQPT